MNDKNMTYSPGFFQAIVKLIYDKEPTKYMSFIENLTNLLGENESPLWDWACDIDPKGLQKAIGIIVPRVFDEWQFRKRAMTINRYIDDHDLPAEGIFCTEFIEHINEIAKTVFEPEEIKNWFTDNLQKNISEMVH